MAMQLTRAELLALYRGGYLHDVGKVAVPDTVLFKPSALNVEEWTVMRKHPVVGESICRGLGSLSPVLPIIRSHHERWDGSGYPDGLRGPGIPLLARVLQLPDIYDALTSVRPYKRAFSSDEALAVMQEETDRGWRDPELMELFMGLHRRLMATSVGSAGVEESLTRMETSLDDLQYHLAPQPTPRTAGKKT
jgi:putative two-component system response regulator